MAVASDENRRPIKSRQWPVFHSAAAWLARVGVSPDVISLTSIVFGILAGLAFASTARVESETLRRVLWVFGALCVQMRLVANLLDGLVAVEGGRASAVGELYNEAPDRVADATILLGLGYADGGDPMLGALASVVAVFTAYVRALGANTGVGQVFLGPMAKPQRMAVVTAAAMLCALTPRSWQIDVAAQLDVVDLSLLAIIAGGLFTAARRLRRIAQLLRQR